MQSFRYIIFTFALLCCTASLLHSQSMVIYDIDASAFPMMHAKLAVFDRNGNPIRDFIAGDLTITENGIRVTGIIIDCPVPGPEIPLNAILVTDRSGSMNTLVSGGKSRLDLVKEGADAFVRMMNFTPPTAVAVTAFDSDPLIIRDFSNFPDSLIASINAIGLGGGTEYNPAFIDPYVGAITMLATRPDTIRRVLIFLTDGEPNHRPDVQTIIDQAQSHAIHVYALTVGMPMNKDLYQIAQATGGASFANVTTEEQIRSVYLTIALASRGIEPCNIRWVAPPGCGFNSEHRIVNVDLHSHDLIASGEYSVQPQTMAQLETDVTSLAFGAAVPPAIVTKTITLTARNGDFTITNASISPSGGFTVTNWGGLPPPFTLNNGTSRTIAIRFTPTDSLVYSAELSLETIPCPLAPISLIGGARRTGADQTIQLFSPIGGEQFSGCDSVHIHWGGVAPSDTVTIEYSDDNGSRWKTITTTATGLSYLWKPPSPGAFYRIRISLRGDDSHIISTIAGGGDRRDQQIATQMSLSSPTGIAVSGNTLYFAESGGHLVWSVNLPTDRISGIAGTGQPGSNDATPATSGKLNNPSGVAISGDTLYIADYSNHRIRRVVLQTMSMTTIAGTGQSGFSGDGGLATAAMLQYPTQLAFYGNTLLFSDAGNNRIRGIDLTTGTINTIAGGGTNPVGSNGQARVVMLDNPDGIAVAGDYLYIAEKGAHLIRRVDLHSGTIATIAGIGSPGTTGDGGAALNAQLSGPNGLSVAGKTLFVTDTGSYRIRRIDLATGIITAFAGDGTKGFAGDSGDAAKARFDHPGQPEIAGDILYVPDVGNNRVRAITLGRSGGSDTSRSPFSVSAARLAIAGSISKKKVDLGQMAIGGSRDSSVQAAICNVGDLPLMIDSVHIIGTDAADFALVSGLSSAEVPTGNCRAIEFRFSPSATGLRSADAIIIGRCANSDTIHLSGIGITSCGYTALDFADLGKVTASTSSPDTILKSAICNNGSNTLDGMVTLDSPDGSFSIVSGGGTFTLAPGGCHAVTVRFAPRSVGRATAILHYGVPASCGQAITRLFGQGTGPAAISVADLLYPQLLCVSWPRDTSILIRNNGGAMLQITDAQIVLNNEGFSLLAPIPSATTPLLIPPDSTGSLHIRFNADSTGDKSASLRITSNISSVTVAISGRRDSLRLASTDNPLAFLNNQSASFPRDSFAVIENTGIVEMEIIGGEIVGPDNAHFQLDANQFPIKVPSRGSSNARVRVLDAPTGNSFHAMLRLHFTPTCDSGIIVVDLVVAGEQPELSAVPMTFEPLICASESNRDTMLAVHNVGGSMLQITSYRIDNDAESSFSFNGTLPVSLASGDVATLPIRFAPKSVGAKSAILVLISNAGETTIPLSGKKETIAFSLSSSLLLFQTSNAGSPVQKTFTITNNGTTPLTWNIPSSIGHFSLISIDPPVTPAGGRSTITIQFDGAPEGEYRDTMMISETRCGTASLLALQADVGTLTHVSVSLPVDSAKPGDHVMLPLRIAIDDPAVFAKNGAKEFTATLLFRGTLLIPDSVTNGMILAKPYDPKTATQRVTIKGEYHSSDTLTSLIGTAMLGDSTSTPLIVADIQWDRFGVETSMVNGLFTVIGTCRDVGFTLVPAPRVLKIAPSPITGSAGIEIELDMWMNLRASLVDALGVNVKTLADRFYEAGEHTISVDVSTLPSGVYSLVLETPFARVVRSVIVMR